MTYYIYASLAIWLAVCVALSVYSGQSQKGKGKGNNPLKGKWQLIELEGRPVDTRGLLHIPFLEFGEEHGQVTGSTGCSRIVGRFETRKYSVIIFNQPVTTQMACRDMQMETRLLNALAKVKRYHVRGRLLFMKSGLKNVMILKKN